MGPLVVGECGDNLCGSESARRPQKLAKFKRWGRSHYSFVLSQASTQHLDRQQSPNSPPKSLRRWFYEYAAILALWGSALDSNQIVLFPNTNQRLQHDGYHTLSQGLDFAGHAHNEVVDVNHCATGYVNGRGKCGQLILMLHYVRVREPTTTDYINLSAHNVIEYEHRVDSSYTRMGATKAIH